ncbi:hypothetical protein BD779DRAFT_235902 [Infundibulicybe gibba]|nr:hypothetical protein BD779DRAFT_235902 [Infundibulicybe gibba]
MNVGYQCHRYPQHISSLTQNESVSFSKSLRPPTVIFSSNMIIIGLLIPFTQMYEMASLRTAEPLDDIQNPAQQCLAFGICSKIAKKAGVRWVPVDYPAGSKRACIILPLYERDDGHPLRMKTWAASKGVAKTRDWLKGHGMSATENLPFVATKDPFYW